MPIEHYRKKPVTIEAIPFTLDNWESLLKFTQGKAGCLSITNNLTCVISTLEGPMTATEGDYIIKGIQGEFYPCKPDIFEATYEKVDE